jgi:hypothetical protein
VTALDLLRGALARVERVRDALEDGDLDFAERVLADLADDLYGSVADLEREAR